MTEHASEEGSRRVVVIAGPNGAGKSTLAPTLLRDRLAVRHYVNADTIAHGLSAFSPEEQAFAAGRIMLARLHALARSRASFAFETTLATRSYARWLSELGKQGYTAFLVFLWLRTPQLAVARVAERVRLGGHDVPESVVRRRYTRGIHNLVQLYSKVVARWSVFDTSEGPPRLMATGGPALPTEVAREDLWSAFLEASA